MTKPHAPQIPVTLNQGMAQADQAGFIDGLLVIRNGLIVAEQYFNGYDSSQTHNVMSVSKSFLSAIAGLAFRDGYLDSLDQRVLPHFSEFVEPGIDPGGADSGILRVGQEPSGGSGIDQDPVTVGADDQGRIPLADVDEVDLQLLGKSREGQSEGNDQG